jgi:hypothetical protein
MESIEHPERYLNRYGEGRALQRKNSLTTGAVLNKRERRRNPNARYLNRKGNAALPKGKISDNRNIGISGKRAGI